MDLVETFGQNLRRARIARGLTIEELASDVGLSYSYVGELERGRRNPSLKVMGRLADILQVSVVQLLSR